MTRPPRYPIALSLVAALALSGCADRTESAPDPSDEVDTTDRVDEAPVIEPPRGANRSRTVYVPAYSHINHARDNAVLFAITLSVRNVDPSASVVLTHVDYFDTSGHRVRRYLRENRTLAPLESAEFVVDTFDESGGSGANFLVYWEGPADAHPLLTESVMIGHIGAGYVAFSSRGVELSRPPVLEAVTGDDPGGGEEPTEPTP